LNWFYNIKVLKGRWHLNTQFVVPLLNGKAFFTFTSAYITITCHYTRLLLLMLFSFTGKTQTASLITRDTLDHYTFLAGELAPIPVLKSDNTFWACGANSFARLGDNTNEDRKSFVQVSLS